MVGQQKIAQTADGQMRNRGESRFVVAVDNQPRDLVILVRDDGFVEKRGERQIGQRELRRDAFFAALGDQTGERVAAACRRRPGQQDF